MIVYFTFTIVLYFYMSAVLYNYNVSTWYVYMYHNIIKVIAFIFIMVFVQSGMECVLYPT